MDSKHCLDVEASTSIYQQKNTINAFEICTTNHAFIRANIP